MSEYTPEPGHQIVFTQAPAEWNKKGRVYTVESVMPLSIGLTTGPDEFSTVKFRISMSMKEAREKGMTRYSTSLDRPLTVTLPLESWLYLTGWASAHITLSTQQHILSSLAEITRQVRK